MSTFDSAKIRSFYDAKSALWYAPLGTARPTGLTVIPSGYALVGALSSKGPGETRENESESETLWQGATAFELTSSAKIEFDAELMEHTSEVFALLNGSPITNKDGYHSQIVNAGNLNPIMEFIIDGWDKDVLHRILFRGRARLDGESRMEAGKPTMYPIKISVIDATYEIRTNDPNWVAVS